MPDGNQRTLMSNVRPGANLIVKQGPQIGIFFPVNGDRLVLGREETCDIVIQDAEVSRRHCELSWQGNHFSMQDLGSTNGVFVNGRQITAPTSLNPGDIIGLGQTTLMLELETESGIHPAYEAPAGSALPTATQMQAEPVAKNQAAWQSPALLWGVIGVGAAMLMCMCSVVTLMLLDMAKVIQLF